MTSQSLEHYVRASGLTACCFRLGVRLLQKNNLTGHHFRQVVPFVPLVMVYGKTFRLKIWVDYVGFLKILICIHRTVVAECKRKVLAGAEKWSPSTEISKYFKYEQSVRIFVGDST